MATMTDSNLKSTQSSEDDESINRDRDSSQVHDEDEERPDPHHDAQSTGTATPTKRASKPNVEPAKPRSLPKHKRFILEANALDKDWNRKSWAHNVNKTDLTELLHNAGYKKVELVGKTASELAGIIVARRKHREDELLIPESTEMTVYGKPKSKPGRKLGANAEAVTGDMAYTTGLPSYTRPEALEHLEAIKTQAEENISASSSASGNGFAHKSNGGIDDASTTSETVLHNDDGDVIFSRNAQFLVYEILQYRKDVLKGPETRLSKSAETNAIMLKYAEACGGLMNEIEAQVGGLAEARELVDEMFGMHGDAKDKDGGRVIVEEPEEAP